MAPALVALLMSVGGVLADSRPGWVGAWTYDLCHEDRKPGHDADSYCRQGLDRIEVTAGAGGVHDITLCPANPWGEKDVRIDPIAGTLSFRTRDGLDVRLSLEADGSHYKGVFRTTDGHSGRVWGRRIASCAAVTAR